MQSWNICLGLLLFRAKVANNNVESRSSLWLQAEVESFIHSKFPFNALFLIFIMWFLPLSFFLFIFSSSIIFNDFLLLWLISASSYLNCRLFFLSFSFKEFKKSKAIWRDLACYVGELVIVGLLGLSNTWINRRPWPDLIHLNQVCRSFRLSLIKIWHLTSSSPACEHP